MLGITKEENMWLIILSKSVRAALVKLCFIMNVINNNSTSAFVILRKRHIGTSRFSPQLYRRPQGCAENHPQHCIVEDRHPRCTPETIHKNDSTTTCAHTPLQRVCPHLCRIRVAHGLPPLTQTSQSSTKTNVLIA